MGGGGLFNTGVAPISVYFLEGGVSMAQWGVNTRVARGWGGVCQLIGTLPPPHTHTHTLKGHRKLFREVRSSICQRLREGGGGVREGM